MQIYTDNELSMFRLLYLNEGTEDSKAILVNEAATIATGVLDRMPPPADEDSQQAGYVAAIEAIWTWQPRCLGFARHIAAAARYGALHAHSNEEADEIELGRYDQESEEPTPEEATYQAQLVAAVERLSPDDTWAMKAYFGIAPIAQHSVTRIAVALGISKTSAYARISRLLAKLAKEVK